MILPGLLAGVTAEAVVPEQVIPYVCSVTDSKARMIEDCVAFESPGELVLVAYPLHDPGDEIAMARAAGRALQTPGIEKFTVIGPARPHTAPQSSLEVQDWYYTVPLPPPPPGQKLRNLLRRASRELRIERGAVWNEDHADLVRFYLDSRHLDPGTRWIFNRLPRYLDASPGSLLLSARRGDGRLAGFAVGEYSSLRTAFFMFCFRNPDGSPPGTADLLLHGLLEEGSKRGQVQMNLGLGVNPGIRFFKGKWGAVPFLPCVQVSWVPKAIGFWARLRRMLRS